MREFRKLHVWQKAHRLALDVHLAMEEGSVGAGRVCAVLSTPKDRSSATSQTVAPKFTRLTLARGGPTEAVAQTKDQGRPFREVNQLNRVLDAAGRADVGNGHFHGG